jgi:hypothetical protein
MVRVFFFLSVGLSGYTCRPEPNGKAEGSMFWLPPRDSNPDKQIQNLLSCR